MKKICHNFKKKFIFICVSRKTWIRSPSFYKDNSDTEICFQEMQLYNIESHYKVNRIT